MPADKCPTCRGAGVVRGYAEGRAYTFPCPASCATPTPPAPAPANETCPTWTFASAYKYLQALPRQAWKKGYRVRVLNVLSRIAQAPDTPPKWDDVWFTCFKNCGDGSLAEAKRLLSLHDAAPTPAPREDICAGCSTYAWCSETGACLAESNPHDEGDRKRVVSTLSLLDAATRESPPDDTAKCAPKATREDALMPKDVPGAGEFRDAFKKAVPPRGADTASWVNGYCAGWTACEAALRGKGE